jgi:hypothetical protein
MAEKIRRYELGDINELKVKGATKIEEGDAVGVTSAGYARPLTIADKFAGFAESTVDNTAGSDGDLSVRVRKKFCVQLSVTSAAITDFGAGVYASGPNTFVLTEESGPFIGTIIRFVSSGVAVVEGVAPAGADVDTV